jgi:hypothetical protein
MPTFIEKKYFNLMLSYHLSISCGRKLRPTQFANGEQIERAPKRPWGGLAAKYGSLHGGVIYFNNHTSV